MIFTLLLMERNTAFRKRKENAMSVRYDTMKFTKRRAAKQDRLRDKVLCLYAQGLNYGQIARRLRVSQATVAGFCYSATV